MISRFKNLIYSALSHQGFRRYFANTSWMFGEQMLRIVAGFLVGVWVARYLGPEKFGLFSYAIAFASLFGSIAKLGLDSIVVRDLVLYPALRNAYMGTAFWLKLVGAFLMLAMVALSTLFASNDSNTNLYVFIIASGIIFQSFEVVDFYFQSQVLSKFVSVCKITQLLISSLIKLYLILIGADLFWFVVLSLIDQITLAISLYIAYRYQKIGNFFRYFDFSLAFKMLNTGWPLILSGLAIMIYMRIDQIMIHEMLGEKEVGLYSAATRISEVWYFVPVIITSSFFPAIINAKKTNQELYSKRLRQLHTIMIYFAVGIALPVTLLAESIVMVLYGADYKNAGLVLSIHIWAGIFVGIGVVNGGWFLAENLQKLATLNTLIGAVANVVLNYFMIPIYGISGAAFATLVSQGVAAYLSLFFHKKTKIRFYEITSTFLPKWRSIHDSK